MWFGLRALCGLAAGLSLSLLATAAARAQTPLPIPDAPMAASDTADEPRGGPCQMRLAAQTAGRGAVVQDGGEGLQRKRWQAVGAPLEFTLAFNQQVPVGAPVVICFRWQSAGTPGEYTAGSVIRTDLSQDGLTLTVRTVVPRDLKEEPGSERVSVGFGLVPVADVRILVFNTEQERVAANSSSGPPFADVQTAIGVTYVWGSLLLTVAILALGVAGLMLLRPRTFSAGGQTIGPRGINPFLAVIATKSGYASLSQFQILLWTLVIAASAIYVATLSGALITITDGALILLGISGGATIASKLQSQNMDAQQDAAAKAAGAASAVAGGALPPPLPVKSPHAPSWADLVVTESTMDGVPVREIDVTRVQMLCFTLITAGFVVITVFSSSIIPEIPPGFLILMGISNGVYVGNKLTQQP